MAGLAFHPTSAIPGHAQAVNWCWWGFLFIGLEQCSSLGLGLVLFIYLLSLGEVRIASHILSGVFPGGLGYGVVEPQASG